MKSSIRDAKVESSLAVALILSVVGGYLDSYVYLAHGHIFANAQTGNVVFMALAVVHRDWAGMGRCAAPILAFLVGVFTVDLLQSAARRKQLPLRATHAVLLLEMLILSATALLPRSIPDLVFALCVSFAASMQFTAFGLVGPWNYTSIATTGNLRKLANAVYAYFMVEMSSDNARSLIAFGSICGAFIGGIILGAMITGRIGNPASAVPAILLGMTLLYLRIRQATAEA